MIIMRSPILTICKKGYITVPIKNSENPWVELTGEESPYTHSATVKLTNMETLHNSVYELINNNPVLFSTYGFAIKNVNTYINKTVYSNDNYTETLDAEITIYSIGQPTEDVELTIGIEL